MANRFKDLSNKELKTILKMKINEFVKCPFIPACNIENDFTIRNVEEITEEFRKRLKI